MAPDRSVTHADLQRSRDEVIRVAVLEAAKVAEEKADRRLLAAVEAVITDVTRQIGMSEKVTAAKIDGLKWRMIAALLGGQTMAGLVATLIHTRSTPADVGKVALAVLARLI